MERLSLSILTVVGFLSLSLTAQAECPNEEWGCWSTQKLQQDPLPESEMVNIDSLHKELEQNLEVTAEAVNELEQNLDNVAEVINGSIEKSDLTTLPKHMDSDQTLKVKGLSLFDSQEATQ